MSLPQVAEGDPHVRAHNDEREAFNQLLALAVTQDNFSGFHDSSVPVFDSSLWVTADGSDQSANLSAIWTDAQDAHGVMVLPRGDIGYGSEFATITDRAAIVGYGLRHSRLRPVGNYSGPPITINDCWRNGYALATATNGGTIGQDKSGVFLSGFSIEGDRAGQAQGIITTGRIDNLTISDVALYYLNGKALSLGAEDTMGLVRESRFSRLLVRACGNATNPAVHVSTGATVGDISNQITFTDCDIVYPWGRGLYIVNTRSDGAMRRIALNNLMAHGMYTDATVGSDVVTIEGDIEDISGYVKLNGSVNVGGVMYPAIRFAPNSSSGKRPVLVDMKVALRSMNGHGVQVDGADSITLTGTSEPVSIAGNEVIFSANSTARAIVDIVANSARSWSLDSTVRDKVFGIADQLDVRKLPVLGLVNRGADPATITSTGMFYAKAGAPYYRHPTGDGTITHVFVGNTFAKIADSPLPVNSIALVGDTDLTTFLFSGKTYEVECFIIADGPATADLRLAFSVPSGAALDWTPDALASGITTASGSMLLAAKTAADQVVVGLAGIGSPTVALVRGRLSIGASGGNFTAQFAQGTLDPGLVTVKTGSYMKITRVG